MAAHGTHDGGNVWGLLPSAAEGRQTRHLQPRLAVWSAHIEGTALCNERLTCMVKANTTLQLLNLCPHPS